MKLLRAADRVATPWKNGLGVTREIAVYPPGAGLDEFDWRISMATVDTGGPFSSFPGVDRILTVLEGRLSLKVDGGAPIELGPDSPPLAFPGDISVEADLLSGPVTDLNVMTRRGRMRATLEPLYIDRPLQIAASPTTIILARGVGVDLVHQGRRHPLAMDDAVMFDQAASEAIQLEPRQPLTMFIVRLAPS